MKKRILSVLLCALLMMSCIVPAVSAQVDEEAPISGDDLFADGDLTDDDWDSSDDDLTIGEAAYTVTKISNPDRGEREIDGLTEGGDRENSYTWRLAMRGDEIYIATTRNIASALVNMYAPAFSEAGISVDTFWSLINIVTNGDIPRNDANEGANILSYNRTTGEFKVIYTAGTGDYFRMAVTYGDDVYFGSYSAVPTNPQYILKLDTDGNFTKVFETMGSVSLRANCVYDDGESENLYFAGADDRTPIDEGEDAPVAKMAVLKKSNDDDTVWDRVADFRDFGLTSYDPIHESWAGAPIWELASHDGYIYATAPTHSGFVIYKGHPAADGEAANAYGWYWEEVAGLTNGINNPGLSDVEGGEPGTMRSLIGSVYEFNGELYAYNFDHSFGGEASAFAGFLQQIGGADVKACDYLFYLYNSLRNPQKVWKLNDETGEFEELTAFTELMEGTTNEYVWRLGEYDGDLYVATMDAGIFYNYLTQLTNGSFIQMSKEEKLQKLGYITDTIKMLAAAKAADITAPIKEKIAELQSKLEQIKDALESFIFDEVIDEETAQAIQEYSALLTEVKKFAVQMVKDLIGGNFDYAFSIERGADEETGDDGGLAPTGAFDIRSALESVRQLLPEEEFEQICAEFAQKLLTYDYETAAAEIAERIKTAVKNAVIEAVRGIAQAADELYEKIDGEGIRMYLEINNTVMNSEWGFDLLRTSDGGESFEVITRTGFDDKYNYGCPCFLETEEGLYLGTCNPFYGGQLYLLTNTDTEEPGEDPEPFDGEEGFYLVGDADGDGKVTILDATRIQRWLAGLATDDEIDALAGDADGDEKITVLDATSIQRWLASMETAEGIGEYAERPEEPGRPAEDVLTMETMGEVYAAYPMANSAFMNGSLVMVIADSDHAYRVSSPLSEDKYDEIIAVSPLDPDANERVIAILGDVAIESIEDITSQKLTDEELAALVGKTGQQLYDMGFVYNGYGFGGDTLDVSFVKGCFEYTVLFSEAVENDDDFNAEEACKTLTVASAEFSGIWMDELT